MTWHFAGCFLLTVQFLAWNLPCVESTSNLTQLVQYGLTWHVKNSKFSSPSSKWRLIVRWWGSYVPESQCTLRSPRWEGSVNRGKLGPTARCTRCSHFFVDPILETSIFGMMLVTPKWLRFKHDSREEEGIRWNEPCKKPNQAFLHVDKICISCAAHTTRTAAVFGRIFGAQATRKQSRSLTQETLVHLVPLGWGWGWNRALLLPHIRTDSLCSQMQNSRSSLSGHCSVPFISSGAGLLLCRLFVHFICSSYKEPMIQNPTSGDSTVFVQWMASAFNISSGQSNCADFITKIIVNILGAIKFSKLKRPNFNFRYNDFPPNNWQWFIVSW